VASAAGRFSAFGIDGVPGTSANIHGNRRTGGLCARGKPRSISDPQEALPLAKLTLKAHALGDLECRDDTPLDLLAGLSGSFARSLPPGLIEVRNKSIAFDGCRLKQGQ
jgi:hypothetical protein